MQKSSGPDTLICMSQVDTVALWAGLIASIAGITLSIVATVFALWVSKQSAEVNQQMIRSLQKIESTVEHLSADTRELITAGWNKMLTGLGGESEAESSTSEVSDQISEGVASEVRSELADSETETESQKIERLENALQDLKETVAIQLRRRSNRNTGGTLDMLVEEIRGLPVESKAVISVLSQSWHLTRKQYNLARNNPVLRGPIKRLRAGGFLVPLVGESDDGVNEPVYYFPPNTTAQIKLASQIAGDIPREVYDGILVALRTIGYIPRLKR
jgi:hypothetical protein